MWAKSKALLSRDSASSLSKSLCSLRRMAGCSLAARLATRYRPPTTFPGNSMCLSYAVLQILTQSIPPRCAAWIKLWIKAAYYYSMCNVGMWRASIIFGVERLFRYQRCHRGCQERSGKWWLFSLGLARHSRTHPIGLHRSSTRQSIAHFCIPIKWLQAFLISWLSWIVDKHEGAWNVSTMGLVDCLSFLLADILYQNKGRSANQLIDIGIEYWLKYKQRHKW